MPHLTELTKLIGSVYYKYNAPLELDFGAGRKDFVQPHPRKDE
jgi:hypothetical protein